MGYILTEAFTLLSLVSFTKGFLCLRRGRRAGSFLSAADREIFFQPIKLTANAPVRFLRYAIIAILVMIIGAVEIVIFAPFGAAIVAGVLLVTCTAIVHRGLTEAKQANRNLF
jgi:hypothetical protein